MCDKDIERFSYGKEEEILVILYIKMVIII